jgi:hypothetical protein
MKRAFKISTNIERDSSIQIDYIVTKNTNDVFDKIDFNHSKGQNSFTIIGSYGTGKSSFLWAFEKHLKGESYFNTGFAKQNTEIDSFNFTRIIGEAISFRTKFCEVFGLSHLSGGTNKIILKEFDLLVSDIQEKKIGLVILVDEFGKHLEFIAKNNPDEMYFIQELCEYLNDPLKSVLFITTLHQNVGSYSKGLSKAQRSEWDKVRGRLLEVTFDEPVEQLLFFASKRLAHYKPNNIRSFEKLTNQIVKSNLLGKIGNTEANLFEELYPLDPLAADILTKSLQRYGQNERSLFTFLESEFIDKIIKDGRIFSVADCFDYLIENLNSEIEDGDKNPFKPQWKAAVIAMERCEFVFENNYAQVEKILKLICLVNIFSNSSGSLDEKVICNYAKLSLEISSPELLIEELKRRNIIKYSRTRNKLNFLDGTDIDLEQELIQAVKHIDPNINIVNRINSYVDFDFVPAKRFQFEKGSPRFFAYKVCEELVEEKPINEIDGYINLIINSKINIDKIKIFSSETKTAQLFALVPNIKSISSALFEIDKINYVIGKFPDDKVASRVLNEERNYFLEKIVSSLKKDLFDTKSVTQWVFNGESLQLNSEKDLNKTLSLICEKIYSKSPIFKNEMVNKEALSTPILTARKQLIKALINSGEKENIGFDSKLFPPERTIYLSLIKKTGIHVQGKHNWKYQDPTDESFKQLWAKTMDILCESNETRKPISNFYETLKEVPFKLKQGFLDFWIPIFLIIKKEDYSMYSSDGEYVPHLTPDIMDIIHKTPGRFFVKYLSNKGINNEYFNSYKELVGYNDSNVNGLESSYITIYSNFLRFYRGLEDYAKNTRQLSPQALGVRDAIAKAKDPESALFELIPRALGFNSINQITNGDLMFLESLKGTIKEIRTSYSNLIDLIESNILEHLDISSETFDGVKDQLINKFSSVSPSLISNEQIKIFYNRVISPLDVKTAYWESLTDAVLGKKLDKISDDELPFLLDKLKMNFDILVDFIDLHSKSNSSSDKIIQINVLSSDGITNYKRNVVINPKLDKKVNELELKIISELSSNDEVNKIMLMNLLEKIINKT